MKIALYVSICYVISSDDDVIQLQAVTFISYRYVVLQLRVCHSSVTGMSHLLSIIIFGLISIQLSLNDSNSSGEIKTILK